jgi:hypothetical protein
VISKLAEEFVSESVLRLLSGKGDISRDDHETATSTGGGTGGSRGNLFRTG